MSGIAQFDGFQGARLGGRPLHLAIGMFDGVHLGHRAVIEAAVQSARRSGGRAAVLTFSPHPSALFNPENRTRLILDTAAKVRVLGWLGVETLVTQRFDAGYAAIEAGQFLPDLRSRLPALAAVYVGENWRFGRGRRGDSALLVSEGRRLRVSVFSAPRVNLDGEPISSTRIRQWLVAGDVASANAALGYSYFAMGPVVAGQGLGRTIGFPTLNLAWAPDLQPRFGVYAVTVRRGEAGPALPAIANYGLRPTVGSAAQPRLEVHVLGSCPFGPGDELTVEWLRFVRDERKFPGVDALREQIARDVAEARDALGCPDPRGSG